MTFDASVLLTPADSARAVAGGYSVSLLLVIPLVLAAAAVLVSRSRGHGRSVEALAWRGALLCMAGIVVVSALPLGWKAWVMPQVLAAPLVSLGVATMGPGSGGWARVVPWLVAGWVAGSLWAAARWAGATRRFQHRVRDRVRCVDAAWLRAWRVAEATVPVGRPVVLATSAGLASPVAMGVRSLEVVVPTTWTRLSHAERVAVLMHERSHLADRDPWYGVLAQVMLVAFWFHPAVWVAARAFRRSCEHAADERVLASGTRPSDYASLLGRLVGLRASPVPALHGQGEMRRRLRVIVAARGVTLPRRVVYRTVLATSLVFAGVMGSMQVAPTRGALDALSRHGRWEARAWAVVRLAQRPDTIDVARAIALRDPDPHVRAWARNALRQDRRPTTS